MIPVDWNTCVRVDRPAPTPSQADDSDLGPERGLYCLCDCDRERDVSPGRWNAPVSAQLIWGGWAPRSPKSFLLLGGPIARYDAELSPRNSLLQEREVDSQLTRNSPFVAPRTKRFEPQITRIRAARTRRNTFRKHRAGLSRVLRPT